MQADPKRVIFAVCLFIQALHAYLALKAGGLIFGPLTDDTYEMATLQLIPGTLMDLFHRKSMVPAGKLRRLFHVSSKYIMGYFFLLIVAQVALVVYGSPFTADTTEFIARMSMVINSFIAVFLLLNLNWRKPTPPRSTRGVRQPRRPKTPLKPRSSRPKRGTGSGSPMGV
ncbi:hypothetical protein DYU11_03345 [Fibrisoma montanum]|uniref:Uncharacterized protein n=1 Tax=Fibrisoma montanum TaxID=2305895 RepID=A0A418MJ56_9BACT|nr:hypothetical protein [Fibrisoma montanum]RIV27361.1 hypothetical protein DYU11_03345 [Fibrisoma montanum]